MQSAPVRRTFLRAGLGLLCVFVLTWCSGAIRAEETDYKVAGGLAIYLGVVPAEITKGHLPGHPQKLMHGGAPTGRHQYHIVAALFDSATGSRITDAAVVAQVSGVGLSGPKHKLEPMEVAGTVTYGAYFNLPGRDLYAIRLTISRPKAPSITVDFKYDHRR